MSKSAAVGWFLVLAIVAAGAVIVPRYLHDERADRYADVLARGNQMEAEQREGEAAIIYAAALDDPQLGQDHRAELRYRLARAQIAGNDLNGALGTLQELIEDDVKRLNLDLGPLFLDLGDRFAKAGNTALAKNSFMMGRGVSPLRFEEFSRRLERLLPPASAPAGDR